MKVINQQMQMKYDVAVHSVTDNNNKLLKLDISAKFYSLGSFT